MTNKMDHVTFCDVDNEQLYKSNSKKKSKKLAEW